MCLLHKNSEPSGQRTVLFLSLFSSSTTLRTELHISYLKNLAVDSCARFVWCMRGMKWCVVLVFGGGDSVCVCVYVGGRGGMDGCESTTFLCVDLLYDPRRETGFF